MRVTSVVSASTEQASRRLAHRYTAALRALFTQRPSLDGHAQGVDWIAEEYNVLAYDDQRTLGVARTAFLIEVDDVTTAAAGPPTPAAPHDPATDPWADWPVIKTVDVDVEAEALAAAQPTKEET
jgi:hypothetical protein